MVVSFFCLDSEERDSLSGILSSLWRGQRRNEAHYLEQCIALLKVT